MTDPTRTGKSHAPKDSVFFEKVVPALLVFMGVLLAVLIFVAAGVLLGFIHF
jgi:hypothetical protein